MQMSEERGWKISIQEWHAMYDLVVTSYVEILVLTLCQ